MLALKMSDALDIIIRTPLFALTGSFFCELQRFIQRVQELIDLDWFGEIAKESSLQSLLDITRIALALRPPQGCAPLPDLRAISSALRYR